MLETIGLIFIAAVFVEGVVEYFFGTPTANPVGETRNWLKYVAAAIGVAFCLVYKLDLLAVFGLTTTLPFFGSVVTGILVGRGSNYLHDLVAKLSPQS